MKVFFIILISIALAYAALLVFARLFAEKIIFPAPSGSYSDSGDILHIPLPGGGEIAAVWIPSKGSDLCAIYSHGNGEDIGEIRPILSEYARRGISVFAYDYPGYGLSTGQALHRRPKRGGGGGVLLCVPKAQICGFKHSRSR